MQRKKLKLKKKKGYLARVKLFGDLVEDDGVLPLGLVGTLVGLAGSGELDLDLVLRLLELLEGLELVFGLLGLGGSSGGGLDGLGCGRGLCTLGGGGSSSLALRGGLALGLSAPVALAVGLLLLAVAVGARLSAKKQEGGF